MPPPLKGNRMAEKPLELTWLVAEAPTGYKPRKLLDLYRDALRIKHYSARTEDTDVNWTKEYILFHHKRHPKEMGAPEINQFLAHLASGRGVSASTQNQAISAILFLYRH